MKKGVRQGSAYLMVLMVMISSMGLVSGIQHLLVRRSRDLKETRIEQKLHNALVLGLEEGSKLFSEDEDLAVDDSSEDWAQPYRFTSTEGVNVMIQLQDAQSLFNLNHLNLPVTPTMPRTWMEIFRDLVRNSGAEVEPRVFDSLHQQIEQNEIWFDSPETLFLSLPASSGIFEVSHLLCAIPRPGSRPQPLNINTVQPEVLQALVGDSLQGWVDMVLAARETRPIRDLGVVLRTVPALVQPLLLSVLDVRTEYVFVHVMTELDGTEKKLIALLNRKAGNVEVLQCRW